MQINPKNIWSFAFKCVFYKHFFVLGLHSQVSQKKLFKKSEFIAANQTTDSFLFVKLLFASTS